jgi:hypothetical protein
MPQPAVESYLKLVVSRAWSAWRKLPPNARAWIDVEDLIQDGLIFARTKAIPSYRPHRGSFKQYIAVVIDQFFMRTLHSSFTMRQNNCLNVPLLNWSCSLASHDTIEQEIHAVETIKKISRDASPLLRKHLYQWLVLHGNVHTGCRSFICSRSEMLLLARKYNFTRDDMDFLLHNETWRKTVQLSLPD